MCVPIPPGHPLCEYYTGAEAFACDFPNSASFRHLVSAGAARPEDLPVNKRVLGTVVSIESGRLTLEARDGQQYTFLVSDSTRFLSRDRQIGSLADIEEGMFLFIAGKDLGDGTYQAVSIALPMKPQP